jgi:hypothetical protein
MTRNFDDFYSKLLSESLRNSWNPERFMRVIPRDLFNEAKMLAMVSKFAKDVNQGKMPGGFIGKLNKKWTVALSKDGELYISGFDLTYKGQKANLTIDYNAGKTNRFPLQVTVENMDLYSVSIYDENGELDSDMIQFQEDPSPGKIDIPDWSSTIEELKRLGKIGLNNNLNDHSYLIPKDDTRGFADSFNNGKITNIKVNKNIVENFDQFCLRFLSESVNDDEYLKAVEAAIKSGNKETVQKMVDEAAKDAGLVEVFRAVRNNAPKLVTRNGYILSFSTRKEVADSYGKTDEDTTRYFLNPSKAFPLQKIGTDYSKIGFDREVLEKGFVVAKGMYDTGPYASLERDPKSLFSYSSDIYGLINPSKIIKSADPVTYDDSGNIIPLSSRFDSSKEDIRY